MQAIELIIILFFICVQVYFFRKVTKKSKLISSILPSKQTVSVKKVYENKDVANSNDYDKSTVLERPRNRPLYTYFYNSMKQSSTDNSCYFEKGNDVIEPYALVKLTEYDDGKIYFYPCCSVNKLKHSLGRKYLTELFKIDTTSNLNDEDSVRCIKRGECIKVENGWKPQIKAEISY